MKKQRLEQKSLLTPEQAREFVKKYNLRDIGSIHDAVKSIFKDALQAALEAEMENELGYSKYDWKNKESGNSRNGHTRKTVRTTFGEVELKMPRDTDAEFEPVMVPKHARQVDNRIEEIVIGLYAAGVATKEITHQLNEIYGVDVSAEMISRITDKVLPLAREWKSRPLDPLYPIIFLDGIVFQVNQDGAVMKKTVYLVFAITLDGHKDILSIWIGESESAKFWMNVLADLKNRGVKDIFIAAVDGLKGFEEAITAIYPKTDVQQCIVHQIRTSTKFVSYKDLDAFCQGLKKIYTSPTEKAALEQLDEFEGVWGRKYPYAIKSWRDNWHRLATFFKYSDEVRRLIYTTNPIEGVNRRIRKVTKTKGSFTSDDALFKLLYLVVMDITEKWKMPIFNWHAVLNQLRIHYGERLEPYLA